MKKKKGFTLIELLAVIVILAIVALIAVPVIMNVLNKANKSAFKDTAYGLLNAGELYYAEQQLEFNEINEEEEFVWPNNLGTLQVKGNVPDGTVLKVNANGEIALVMTNGRYCVTKDYKDKDVKITEDGDNCHLPYTLKDLAVISTQLGVNSIEDCVEKGEVCEIDNDGTAFAIRVNKEETLKFYVLSDDGETINLILNKNLYDPNDPTTMNVFWCDRECTNVGTAAEECVGDTSQGPLVILRELKERTANWTNIEEYSYKLTDGGGIYEDYSGEYVQNVRARLLSLEEATRASSGCTAHGYGCKSFMVENLYTTGNDDTFGYWLSDTESAESAWLIHLGGWSEETSTGAAYSNMMYSAAENGIRPVITLKK